MSDSFLPSVRTTRTPSAGVEVCREYVDHLVGHRTHGAALATGNVVREDRECEQVSTVDADVTGERDDAVERAGLRADPAGRGLAFPAPRECAVEPDPVVLVCGREQTDQLLRADLSRCEQSRAVVGAVGPGHTELGELRPYCGSTVGPRRVRRGLGLGAERLEHALRDVVVRVLV